MARPQRTLQRILSGESDADLAFADLVSLLEWLGFAIRIRGSHHIFTHPEVREIINLQPDRSGNAKPYQVRQVRSLVLKYVLNADDPEI